MMTLIRKWALAVCSALLLTNFLATTNAQNITSLDPSQVYYTGNLVTFDPNGSATTSPWQNVGQWGGQLECWAPGMPGYCGPNPYVNSNGYGNINFSYGFADLHQVVNIAAALPNSGTGLRVNGFNFAFQAKNGNGWDGGAQDYLAAYVNFYGADGKLTQSYDYSQYTNRQYGWTYFSFSETFATPYAAKDLSTARYGFVGYDTNFWAGPYGPEVNSVSFSLKYSVDPCSVDVLSSPNCPGYLDKINSLTPPLTAPTTTTTTTVAPAPATTTTVSEPVQPVTTTTNSSTTTATAPVTVATATATTVTPTATNPQPRVGEVTVSGSPAKTAVNTTQILAIVRNEQSRIAGVEQTAVTAAVTQAQQQSQQAQEQSLSISAATVATSQASAQTAVAMATVPGSVSAQYSSQTNLSGAGTNPAQGIRYNQAVASLMTRTEFETSSSEGLKFASTGPLSNFVNPQPRATEPQAETASGPAVNARVQDNDAAGGVSLTAMARTPVGFEAYMGTIPDSAFYAPREIYRNQRVVDNARIQRSLTGASDRLHQEMVDQQYKNNKGAN